MKKKILISFVSFTLFLFASSISINADQAIETGDSVVQKVEEQENENVVKDLVENDEVTEVNSVTTLNDESVEPQYSPVRPINGVVIETAQELVAALAAATDTAVITIKGGTTITLTDSLKVNTAKVSNLTFASSDGQEVVIKNVNGKRHIEVTGVPAISMTFDKVVISGTSTGINGISIVNNSVGNVIDGLIVRDIEFHTTRMNGEGVVDYRSTNGGSFTIKNSVFENNTSSEKSSSSYSVLYTDTRNTDINIENNKFLSNTIVGRQGSVIYSYHDGTGVYNFKNNIIDGNTSKEGTAGLKIHERNATAVTIDGNTVTNNSNALGNSGAMSLRFNQARDVKISNNSFKGNYGHRGGGAIFAEAYGREGNILIASNVFDGNKGGRYEYNPETGEQSGLSSNGGAIYFNQMTINGSTALTIKDSQFLNNEASTGGAVDIFSLPNTKGAIVSIEGSTFDNNLGDYHGGALTIGYQMSTVLPNAINISNSKFTNNLITGRDTGPGTYQGGNGGAIYYTNIGENPASLHLDTVTFENNSSQYPVAWNYSETGTGTMNEIYKTNVKNSTPSAAPFGGYADYNNVYNGDDVWVDATVTTSFVLNNDPEIVVTNYTIDSLVFMSLLGDTIVSPIDPIAEGYRFLGWVDSEGNDWEFDANQPTSKELNLYPKWAKIAEYTITFNSDGGTEIAPQTVTEGGIFTQPEDPIKEGYIFKGWFVDDGTYANAFVFGSVADATVDVIAKWEKIAEYTITFNSDGGTEIAPQTVTEGGMFTKPEDPIKEGYTFEGWFIDDGTYANAFVFGSTAGDSVNVIAKWAPIEEPIVPVEPPVTPPEETPVIPPEEIPVLPPVETPVTPDIPQLPGTGLTDSYLSYALIGIGGLLVAISLILRKKKIKQG